MNFEPDIRWSIFLGCETYESFLQNALPEIYLKPEVHEDVRNSFRVIEKLLQHSYYEYEFYDIAGTKTLLTLELALKFRYIELFKGKLKQNNLGQLIQWFLQGKYFEAANPKFLENIRWIRNHLAHPDRYSFGGATMRQWIEHSINLINSIYEDVGLRKKRVEMQKSLLPKFRRITKHGATFTYQGQEEVLFDAFPFFIDNKQKPKEILFAFLPIDEPQSKPIQRKKLIVASSHKFRFNRDESEVTIVDHDNGSEINISSILSEDNKSRMEKFRKDYFDNIELAPYRLSLQSDLDSFYNEALRAFHKK